MMNNITPEKIYDKTNKGLDILLFYYPQAKACIDNKKHFAIRSEKTPSAAIKLLGSSWVVTDFGEDSRAMSPIDVCMREENITFREALVLLATRYEVIWGLDNKINKPEIRKRKAENEEKPVIEFKDFTAEELEIFCPSIKVETLEKLKWRSVKSYTIVKDDDVTVINATDNYPIFSRECGDFEKIYQPCNPDKAFRFFYRGNKPKDFVNGLKELQRDYKAYNTMLEKAFFDDEKNEGKTFRPKKLEAAVICSGERDAACCYHYGYNPIWLNSETGDLNFIAYKEISEMVGKIYYIGDIDTTGQIMSKELASKFLGLYVVRLPQWLLTYKDNRGRPRKDLRDFLDLRPNKFDFENLLKMAMPYQFWEITKKEDGRERLEINSAYLLQFLADSGFCQIEDGNKNVSFVRVEDKIVREITPQDIRSFLLDFVRKKVHDIDIINLVLNSKRTSTNVMNDLPKIDFDFIDNDIDRQFLFFNNKTFEILPDKIIDYQHKFSPKFIHEKKIIKHDFKRLEPSFRFDEEKGEYQILHTKSLFMSCLINTSRTFWREELEHRVSDNEQENERYNLENKFSLTGKRLSDEEILLQMLNFRAKCFAVGYNLHRYKAQDKSWMCYAMEDSITEDGKSNGGSGKSFMFKFLDNIKSVITIDGRNRKLTDNPHLLENVDKRTDILLIDDAHQFVDMDYFYNMVTGGMNVNEKHIKTRIINYAESPKLAVTSNFPLRNLDPSTARRILFVVFSDYYHYNPEDKELYKENRTIADDFGMALGTENYSKENWNLDFNFLVDCLQYYLKVATTTGEKIHPPLDKVMERRNLSIMGNQFKDWAEVYFAENSPNLDREISKNEVFNIFKIETGLKQWSTIAFTKALKAFCQNTVYINELNPQSLCSPSAKNRIIRKELGTVVEKIYIQSVGNQVIIEQSLF